MNEQKREDGAMNRQERRKDVGQNEVGRPTGEPVEKVRETGMKEE